MIILAHGALGRYDELIFIGILVVFLSMMVVSWIQSRLQDPQEGAWSPTQFDDMVRDPVERFELE